MNYRTWSFEFGDRERVALAAESPVLPPEVRYATIVERCRAAGHERLGSPGDA